MYWNDHKTAISSKPIKKAVVNSSKVFASEGNPQMGQPATILTGDFVNTVQEELINVVEKAGLTLDKSDDTQLYQAIESISRKSVPRPLGYNGSVLTVVDKEKEIVEWQKPNVVKVVQGSVDIYVATTGDDKTGDGSKDRPFKTIQKAVNESYKYMPDNGQHIYIRIATGTYHETVTVDGKKLQSALIFFYEDGVVIRALEDKYSRFAMQIKHNAIVYNHGTPTFYSTAVSHDGHLCGILAVQINSYVYFHDGLNIKTSNTLWAISVEEGSALYLLKNLNIIYSAKVSAYCAFNVNKNSYLQFSNFSGTIHGNPNYLFGTLWANLESMCSIHTTTTAFQGSTTGRRFHLSELSFVHSFGKGVNFLPGSAAGEAYHGSQYI